MESRTLPGPRMADAVSYEGRTRTVCILSMSAIPDDPRVRRQGDAFHAAGWKVIGVGLAGARSAHPAWQVVAAAEAASTPAPQADASWCRTVRSTLSRVKLGLVELLYISVLVRRALAWRIYWSWPQVKDLWRAASGVTADVWIANDWRTLPIASRLVEERGGVMGYDTHEYAVAEFEQSWRWRMSRLPMVRVLERHHIRGAGVVSAVSAGIATDLGALYGLTPTPSVIRNVPHYQKVPFRPTGRTIRILYHGIIVPNRGLETAIETVAFLDPNYLLSIRGPASEYLSVLKQKAESCRVADRVEFLPPVPMVELVASAQAFDIGIMWLPGNSRHNRYALPNKFFEYVMAGLALAISDLPEMVALVRRFDLGVVLPSLEPLEISRVIRSLDRSSIDLFKRNALAAASELCWEKESGVLVAAYAKLAALQR